MEWLRWAPAGAAAGYAVWKVLWMIRRHPGRAEILAGRFTTYAFFTTFLLNLFLSFGEGCLRGAPPLPPAILGAVLLAARIGVLERCVRALGKDDAYFISVTSEQRLVQSGPYAWCRHPIYASRFLMTAGMPLVFGAWCSLPAFLLLDGALVVLRVAEEEKILRRRFGSGYARYASGVFALVPLPPFLLKMRYRGAQWRPSGPGGPGQGGGPAREVRRAIEMISPAIRDEKE